MNLQFSKDRLCKTEGGSPQGPSNSSSLETTEITAGGEGTPALPHPLEQLPSLNGPNQHLALVQGSGFIDPAKKFCSEEVAFEKKKKKTGEGSGGLWGRGPQLLMSFIFHGFQL